MINVVDACLKHDVRELILASSSEVYHEPPVVPTDESAPLCIPDPHNPRYSYAAGKQISEIIALNYGRIALRSSRDLPAAQRISDPTWAGSTSCPSSSCG